MQRRLPSIPTRRVRLGWSAPPALTIYRPVGKNTQILGMHPVLLTQHRGAWECAFRDKLPWSCLCTPRPSSPTCPNSVCPGGCW